jgi:hypothetical protein
MERRKLLPSVHSKSFINFFLCFISIYFLTSCALMRRKKRQENATSKEMSEVIREKFLCCHEVLFA